MLSIGPGVSIKRPGLVSGFLLGVPLCAWIDAAHWSDSRYGPAHSILAHGAGHPAIPWVLRNVSTAFPLRGPIQRKLIAVGWRHCFLNRLK